MASSNVDKLIVAKMDFQRFKAVNTANGDWKLLEKLCFTPESDSRASEEMNKGVVSEERAQNVTLEMVQKVVRDVGEALLGETLQGIAELRDLSW